MASVIKPEAALLDGALLNKTAHGTANTAPNAQSVHNPSAQNLQNQSVPQSGALPAHVKVPASAIPAPGNPVLVGAAPQPALTSADVFKAAAVALGLPQDALTNTLLTFARFFSVTPEPALLSNLRKEVLTSGASSPKTAKERTATESKALALLAALDKGVALGRDALDEYAHVHQKYLPENNDFSGQSGHKENKKRQEDQQFDEKEHFEAQDIKKLFENSGQNTDEKQIFDLLNRIPGKNGQRWIVWPFNITSEGIELHILVRILLKEVVNHPKQAQLASANSGGWLFADIIAEKRAWHFIFNKSGKEKLDVNVSVFPGFPQKAEKRFQKEVRNTLKNMAPQTEIHFWNEEQPSLAKELANKMLQVVNKEV